MPPYCRYAWFAPRTGDFDWIGPSASLLQPGSSQLTRGGALYTHAPCPYSNPSTSAAAPSPAVDAGTARMLGDPYASSSYPDQNSSTLAEALAPAAAPEAGGGVGRQLAQPVPRVRGRGNQFERAIGGRSEGARAALPARVRLLELRHRAAVSKCRHACCASVVAGTRFTAGITSMR